MAHVKDHSEFRRAGLFNHGDNNLLPMCYDCHYNYFDEQKMSIFREKNGHATFFKLNNEGVLEVIHSEVSLNIRDEYLKWKNSRVVSSVKFAMVKYKNAFKI